MLPEGCTPDDPANCAELRGSVFKPNESTIFSNIGLYQLGLLEEKKLGYSGNGSFGHDNVRFGYPGEAEGEASVVEKQVVEGFATKDFYLGGIGINANDVNITTFGNRSTSLLTSLRNQGVIPSRSW